MSVSTPAGAAEVFAESGFADGHTVANFRKHVTDWLDSTVAIGNERLCDILLATDEALANCASHAYRDTAGGLMTLQMSYDPAGQIVRISVTDQGRWIDPVPTVRTSIRGRGLILMRALADTCTIDGRVDGTTVCLQFHACPPRGRHARAS